jgi:hypothetical protein
VDGGAFGRCRCEVSFGESGHHVLELVGGVVVAEDQHQVGQESITCRIRQVDLDGAYPNGPSAGADNDHTCITRGSAGDLYANRSCARCILVTRLQTFIPPEAPRFAIGLPIPS